MLLLLKLGALRRRLTPTAGHINDDGEEEEEDATIIVTPITILVVAFIIISVVFRCLE
jgi:type II secretory pathway component PulF